MKVPESGRVRVLHVITGLGTGGAEMMLFKVLQATCKTIESRVVCLMKTDATAARIEALDVPVHCFGMERGHLPGPAVARALRRVTAEFRPTVIQGWMYHGNLAALFAASRQKPEPRLIWNIRQTLYGFHLEGRLTRWIIRLGAWFSTRPDTIIYNSRVSVQQHQAVGYVGRRSIVIPNGFDLMAYFPDSAARDAVREEFHLPYDTLLIGHVARFHPMKGHAFLLQAAKRVVSLYPNARFVLIGSNISRQNPEIAAQLDAMNLQNHVVLAGERTDIPRLAAAMDIAISASEWGEGFPNAVGEAMAAGVPCVVSDVGDSAVIVGETGRVVPPGDAEALAAAISELLALSPEGRQQLGRDARTRVREMFALERVGRMYLDLYEGRLNA